MEDDNKIAPIGFFTSQIFKGQNRTPVYVISIKFLTRQKFKGHGFFRLENFISSVFKRQKHSSLSKK